MISATGTERLDVIHHVARTRTSALAGRGARVLLHEGMALVGVRGGSWPMPALGPAPVGQQRQLEREQPSNEREGGRALDQSNRYRVAQ